MMAEASTGLEAGGESLLPLEIPVDLHDAMIAATAGAMILSSAAGFWAACRRAF